MFGSGAGDLARTMERSVEWKTRIVASTQPLGHSAEDRTGMASPKLLDNGIVTTVAKVVAAPGRPPRAPPRPPSRVVAPVSGLVP